MELYALPLVVVDGEEAERLHEHGIAELNLPDGQRHTLCYGFAVPAFARTLFELVRQRERLPSEHGELQATRTSALRQSLNGDALPDPVIQQTNDGNTIAMFGDKFVLKFFHRLWTGTNPELEIGWLLAEKNFSHSPPLLGALEYFSDSHKAMTLAVAKACVPQAVNAWDFTLDALSRYYDRAFADAAQGHEPPSTEGDGTNYIGTMVESARLLGKRTAELHLAFASGPANGEFCTMPMTRPYLRSVFQSMRSLAIQNLRLLKKQAKILPADLAPVAQRVGELEPVILERYGQLVNRDFDAARIRIHGDFHLSQVLWTGQDFVFLDFEGDPTVPISERCIKRSPLQDVARMMRSFHHAAYAGFGHQVELGVISRENLPRYEPWVRHWNRVISREYLQVYCQELNNTGILPSDEKKLRILLLAYILNQVMDELGDELRMHSDKVRAPLQAIIHLTDEHLLQQINVEAPPKNPGDAKASS